MKRHPGLASLSREHHHELSLARALRRAAKHMELNGLARELRAQVAAGAVEPETVAALGTLLHDHVRLEEREIFEDIRRVVPSAELDALA